ncbi:carbon starvation protein A [uncultured Clostridium sp.]|uniref:carbon starvation CstA family protein n=1 Tax=uncultured Clostridium sp. TaxID=59620 RepID=UPI0025E668B6|nr:carbon starvation protein A [uncultured Clostridium sp.]
MNGLIILGFSILVLGGAYLLYGRWLANKWGIDSKAKTPAYTHEDGEDYIPTAKPVVFGHQFSSIAGAGPVTGPIIAAMFGWLPVLIWLLIGGIFFGAVHDFGALYASVKNEGKSIGCIIEKYIGKTGKKLFLLFCWIFSLLVIAAFSDMVSNTFNGFNKDGSINTPNAAAASISMLFIVVAMIFGIFIKYKKPSQITEAIIGIILFIAMVAVGIYFPLYFGKNVWTYIVFGYLFLAAILPMWLLMQPRDYLTTFLLISMVIGAVLGVLVANPSMNLNAFNGFEVKGNMLFPTLFVTIACGAVSGFHSLVSSGTSSKQVSNEKDMLCIGFGAMIVETLIGVIALVAVGSVSVGGMLPEGTPFSIFASSIAGFLGKLGVPEHVAVCFMTMCVSALALTSLDSVARIGRMSFQEFFMDDSIDIENMTPFQKVVTNKYFATIITLVLGLILSLGGYNNVWPLFGAGNQLLSALVLITIAVFLKTTGRKSFMLYVPMFMMLLVTFTALVQAIVNICKKLFVTGEFIFLTDGLQLIFAILLMSLGVMVAKSSFKKLFHKTIGKLKK